MSITAWVGCRVCGARLQSVLNLGELYVSSFPLPDEPDGLAAPLDLCRCVTCGLVQLGHSVNPAYLYREYWYRSGINETMVAELRDVVTQAMERTVLTPEDTVIDIGANDGTLLAQYPADYPDGPTKIAYEPAENLQAELSQHADVIVPKAFPCNGTGYYPKAKAKIITTIACFYDLDDPVTFARAVKDLLHPDGVWCVQFQDLHQMLQATAFDNICHEHVTYLSLAAMQRIADQADLRIVAVERRAINGGSLRVWLQHAAHHVEASVDAWWVTEAGCESWVALETFAHKVRERKAQIRAALTHVTGRGGVIDLYGASTKANTLLQACGVSGRMIRQAWERSEPKWGRQTVGSRIPIVSEEEGRSAPPDLLLAGIWQFRDAIVVREQDYLAHGGRLLFPLPQVEVVYGA